MPCQDVSDKLTVILNPDDTIRAYSFAKNTCGGAVGNKALLMPWLKGKTWEQIMNLDYEVLLKEIKAEDETAMFLVYKHLTSLQALGQVLEGDSFNEVCEIDEMLVEPDFTKITAFLKVIVDPKIVKSCGHANTKNIVQLNNLDQGIGCGSNCKCNS